MTACKESEEQLHSCLTSGPEEDDWAAWQIRRFPLGETGLSTGSVWGWMGPRASMDLLHKRQICAPAVFHPAHNIVTILIKLLRLQT